MQGKWIFPNGTVYDGPFMHNKPNGEGRFTFGNKNEVKGFYTQTIVPNANPVKAAAYICVGGRDAKHLVGVDDDLIEQWVIDYKIINNQRCLLALRLGIKPPPLCCRETREEMLFLDCLREDLSLLTMSMVLLLLLD